MIRAQWKTLLMAAAACVGTAFSIRAQAHDEPWKIQAVVLTTYENGADTGDKAGELQPWVEHEHLTEKLPFPLGVHDIYTDRGHHLLVVMTGMTTGPAAASVMALGLDPRFDLSKAYWLIDGCAGFDPTVAPEGSAAWITHVVGSVMKELDLREMPKDWPYGKFLTGANAPDRPVPAGPVTPGEPTLLFTLNPSLVAWAYSMTDKLPLVDPPELAHERQIWRDIPAATRKPVVLKGDELASDVFWHGRMPTQFARNWVKLVTHGEGQFTASEMEDSGMMESLMRLGHAGRIDDTRVLILRTASNYTQQPQGMTAEQSINGHMPAEAPAMENGYRVGARIIHEIMNHWPKYSVQTP